MNPIVFQIIPCLFIASLIGFVIAWLLRRTDLRQIHDEVHIQNSHKNKLEFELSQLRTDLSSTQQEKKQLHQDSLSLTDQLLTHQNYLSSAHEKIAESHQLITSKETALETLTTEHSLNLKANQELQAELTQAQQSNAVKQQEIDQAKARQQQIQTELEQHKKNAAQLRQSIEGEFKSQLEQHASNLEGLKKEQFKATELLQADQLRLTQKIQETHNEELKHEKLKAKSDLSTLQAEYARFQHEQQSLNKQRLGELHKVQEQLEEKSKELLTSQENHATVVTQLKNQYSQQWTQNEAAFKSKTDALEKQHALALEKLQAQHAQILQNASQRSEQAQQQLQKQIQEQVAGLKQEQAKSLNMAQQLQDSQSKQSSLMSKVQELGQRMTGLATEHEHTQNLFNALKTVMN